MLYILLICGVQLSQPNTSSLCFIGYKMCIMFSDIATMCLFTRYRDASFGVCSFNLTLLDTLHGVNKVSATFVYRYKFIYDL